MRAKATIALDPELWHRLKRTCALMDLYPSHVIEDFIKSWLKRNEQKARDEVAKEGQER